MSDPICFHKGYILDGLITPEECYQIATDAEKIFVDSKSVSIISNCYSLIRHASSVRKVRVKIGPDIFDMPKDNVSEEKKNQIYNQVKTHFIEYRFDVIDVNDENRQFTISWEGVLKK